MVEARKALTEPTLLLHLCAHAGNRLGKRKKLLEGVLTIFHKAVQRLGRFRRAKNNVH